MKNITAAVLTLALGALTLHPAMAAELSVPMYVADASGKGQPAGSIEIRESPYGLLFQAHLKTLTAGVHGFHVHERPSCEPATIDGKVVPAGAAGGHWDPDGTKVHAGPYGAGHRGDLPALHVNADGASDDLVLAPRIHSLDEVRGHALMVHAGGDNYDDHPMPLGGGGARMICGVIPG